MRGASCMELNKMLDVAKIPAAAIIIINIVALVIGLVPVIGLAGGLLGLLAFFVLNPILIAWRLQSCKEIQGRTC